MHSRRFSLSSEDDKEKEKEKQLKFFADRTSDPEKGSGLNKDYPHKCTECGRPALILLTRPHCTNRFCKWYDKEKLSKPTTPTVESYDPNLKTATINPVAADDYDSYMNTIPFGD